MSAARKRKDAAGFRGFMSLAVDKKVETEPFLHAKADPDVVEELENLLDQARAGRLLGAAMVVLKPGRRGYLRLMGECAMDLPGALAHSARLQHWVQKLMDCEGYI